MNEVLQVFSDIFYIPPPLIDLSNAHKKGAFHRIENPFFAYYALTILPGKQGYVTKFYISPWQEKTVLQKLIFFNTLSGSVTGKVLLGLRNLDRNERVDFIEIIGDTALRCYIWKAVGIVELIVLQ